MPVVAEPVQEGLEYLERDGQCRRLQQGAGGVQGRPPKGEAGCCHGCAGQLDATWHALCNSHATVLVKCLTCFNI